MLSAFSRFLSCEQGNPGPHNDKRRRRRNLAQESENSVLQKFDGVFTTAHTEFTEWFSRADRVE